MDKEIEICARNREVEKISLFISSRIETRKSGILYLTGPPGTGKTMSIQYVLDQVSEVPKININCLRAQTSKVILSKICSGVGLEKFIRKNESEMIERLTKKLTGRTCGTHLIVLDEMDKLPKSKNADLIRRIFSWPNLPNSKLILVGIANTVNLTSKYQMISSIIGHDHHHVTKIIFKPYTSKDIKEILQWYIENDENYEDTIVDEKALDMIAAKSARENGDIRGALNGLRLAIDDTLKKEPKEHKEPQLTYYPTPPSTPPPSPCKEKTNMASVANSMRKRQRATHFKDDKFPFGHQIVLTCIYKLASEVKDFSVESLACKNLVNYVLPQYEISNSLDDYRSMLDNLEQQGFITFKKGRLREKIILKSSESELENLLTFKDMIMNTINSK